MTMTHIGRKGSMRASRIPLQSGVYFFESSSFIKYSTWGVSMSRSRLWFNALLTNGFI